MGITLCGSVSIDNRRCQRPVPAAYARTSTRTILRAQGNGFPVFLHGVFRCFFVLVLSPRWRTVLVLVLVVIVVVVLVLVLEKESCSVALLLYCDANRAVAVARFFACTGTRFPLFALCCFAAPVSLIDLVNGEELTSELFVHHVAFRTGV